MTADRTVLQVWEKAEALLREARALPVETAPSATVHVAYYAMFHAARAVLLKTTGSTPKKHSSVIRMFGEQVREKTEPLRASGQDLNSIEARRIRADYRETVIISSEDAKDALARAVAFLEVCATEFDFPRSEPTAHA